MNKLEINYVSDAELEAAIKRAHVERSKEIGRIFSAVLSVFKITKRKASPAVTTNGVACSF